MRTAIDLENSKFFDQNIGYIYVMTEEYYRRDVREEAGRVTRNVQVSDTLYTAKVLGSEIHVLEI